MVKHTYGIVLCREADHGGLLHHAKLCHSSGLTQDGFTNALKGSGEYTQNGKTCEGNQILNT